MFEIKQGDGPLEFHLYKDGEFIMKSTRLICEDYIAKEEKRLRDAVEAEKERLAQEAQNQLAEKVRADREAFLRANAQLIAKNERIAELNKKQTLTPQETAELELLTNQGAS